MAKRVVFVDCGTENLRIFDSFEGLICDEPSYALLSETGNIMISGKEAKEVFYKPPEGAYPVRPIKNGMVADHRLLFEIMSTELKNKVKRNIFSKPDLIFSVSPFLNSVGRRAIYNLGSSLQFKNISLIPSYIFFLSSFDISPLTTEGYLILDLGAGKIDICVTSFGRMIKGKYIKEGMGLLEKKICKHIRDKYGVDIGNNLDNLYVDLAFSNDYITVSGKDKVTGIPRQKDINSEEIKDIIKLFSENLSANIKMVIEEIAPDLSSDIVKNKLIMVGGGSKSIFLRNNMEKSLEIGIKENSNLGNETIKGFEKTDGMEKILFTEIIKLFEG